MPGTGPTSPGLAGLWVTDTLAGAISGSGNVIYYGFPALDIASPGLGEFRAMGRK